MAQKKNNLVYLHPDVPLCWDGRALTLKRGEFSATLADGVDSDATLTMPIPTHTKEYEVPDAIFEDELQTLHFGDSTNVVVKWYGNSTASDTGQTEISTSAFFRPTGDYSWIKYEVYRESLGNQSGTFASQWMYVYTLEDALTPDYADPSVVDGYGNSSAFDTATYSTSNFGKDNGVLFECDNSVSSTGFINLSPTTLTSGTRYLMRFKIKTFASTTLAAKITDNTGADTIRQKDSSSFLDQLSFSTNVVEYNQIVYATTSSRGAGWRLTASRTWNIGEKIEVFLEMREINNWV